MKPGSTNRPAEPVLSIIASKIDRSLSTGPVSIVAGRLALAVMPGGGVDLSVSGTSVFSRPLSRPWVDYGGRIARSRNTTNVKVMELLQGRVAEMRVEGAIYLPGGKAAPWTHVYTVAAGLESVTVDVQIDYPKTERRNYDRKKAERLARDWDARWRTVAPFELAPALEATEAAPAKVWKHGFFDIVSSYELGYHHFGPNRQQDSLDNHVTDGWVAVSAGGKGLLVAQSAAASTLFAFCPVRTRLRSGWQSVFLNPFGTYYGKQWRYPLAVTGFGRLAALLGADNLDSYAPSWEGNSIRFSLMLAPYDGDEPPKGLQRDALIFATPPEWA
jgi:hypothetical protein